ncbi:NAD-dependent epimerase/dehydratase family protein [Alloyangia pacifica]|uniref:Nucleoside-diphosphate-sugar epimerase n=1 Tax=Alloyangia pacifica TaxID=311180 RepID=A0A1I6SHH4_9RHOB|nr:NAD(P)-dependent oxidoreductase [Alloyangia pacifica]SDG79845.1 Nucleoside-diphosphate-sugar epimerase [Alloyangia pacifica]SFS76359.1 Nucleoside-diphosphate-sugar epimerase [Alloyangia pacifica]
MRILFTGGSGKAGRHVVRHLADEGHRILNADLSPLGLPGVPDLITDLTDPGQVWGAMTSYAGFEELEPGSGLPKFDAVVHFGALARILIKPDCETYRVNTLSTYNVLEAAAKLDIPKVVFASSETTYGICFADGERKPEYLPIDEEHPVVPEDAYALSKVSNEVTARGIQRRTGQDIYGLRISNVCEVEDYHRDFPAYAEDPAPRLRNIFGYIDVRDLSQMVSRCLATDGLGFELFNVANDDLAVPQDNETLRAHFYDGVPVKTPMQPRQAFYSNAKARRMLGFSPQHDWRSTLGG